ncbi:MAG: hypothetical protein RL317_1321 [Pseudomonadota bacterium]
MALIYVNLGVKMRGIGLPLIAFKGCLRLAFSRLGRGRRQGAGVQVQENGKNWRIHWSPFPGVGLARRDYFIFLFLLTATYTVFAYIGLNWAMIAGAGSPVWPAAGVGLAGLLIGGLRVWPAIFIGRVLAALLSGSQQPLWADMAIGLANVLGTVGPVWVIRRLGGIDPRLPTLPDVARFLFGGAALGACISAALGTLILMASSDVAAPQASQLFINWAVGNFAGAVTLGPLVLSWADRERPLSMGQYIHLGLLIMVATFVAMMVFAGPPDEALQTWHLLPIMVWAALAFDVRGASLVLFITSAVAVWATSENLGPLANQLQMSSSRIPLVQQFIAVTALTTLFLATIADERRTKEELRAREERLRAAVEASGAGTFRWRFHSDLLDCDDVMLQLLRVEPGRPPQRLEDLIALFHPEDRTKALQAFDACLRRGSEFRLSARLGAGGAASRIVQGRGRLVSDGQGMPDYVTGAFVDVTERSRLEQRLAKAEETYRAVFEQAGVGVVRLTLAGTILEANERFCAMVGAPLSDLTGADWKTINGRAESLETLADAHADIDLLLSGHSQSSRIERRYIQADGASVWTDESLTLVHDSAGAPAFVLAVVQDVTERKEAEDEVQMRANELAVVLRDVPAAIWFAHDPDSAEVTGNAFSADMLRLPDTTINMSKTGPDARHVSHFRVLDRDGVELSATELPVQRAARGELVRNFEERVVFDDGQEVYLLGNASPLYDGEGRPRGAVAAFIDITDRKQSEARERLLSREVDHRAKNVLAVVQAIVQLTQADSVTGFRRMVAGRIQSLARTHNLLAENRWEGVELHRLVVDELAPFGLIDSDQIDPSRFVINGPVVRLKPAAAQALALVAHELVTNAVKYGALSGPKGHVAIQWAFTGAHTPDQLTLSWVEQGGFPIAPPGASGFGWTVIRTSVEDQLGGKLATDWGPDGLRLEILLPLASLTDVRP